MAPPNTSRPKGLRSLQSGQPLDPIPKLGTYASVIRPYLHDRTPIPAKYRPLREKRLRLVRIRMLRASTSVRQNESRRGILTSSMALAAWKRGRGGVVECTTSPVTTAPASQPATPLPSRSRIEREKPSGEKCKPSGLQHRFLPPRPLTEAWDHRRSRLAQRHERSPRCRRSRLRSCVNSRCLCDAAHRCAHRYSGDAVATTVPSVTGTAPSS